MAQDRILGLLGLAARAGRVESGGFAAEKAVTGGKAHLILLSQDAGKNTVSLFENKSSYYHVPLRILSTKELLGHAIGRGERSCIAVTDEGFAKSLIKLIDSSVSDSSIS